MLVYGRIAEKKQASWQLVATLTSQCVPNASNPGVMQQQLLRAGVVDRGAVILRAALNAALKTAIGARLRSATLCCKKGTVADCGVKAVPGFYRELSGGRDGR